MNKTVIAGAGICVVVGAVIGGIITNHFNQASFAGDHPKAYCLLKKGEIFTGKVTNVHDGDTFTMVNKDMSYNVRVYGTEAPELRQTCQKGNEKIACGEQAKDRLTKLIDGKNLSCQFNAITYNRSAALCTLSDGTDIGQIMVREGYVFDEKKYAHGKYAMEEQEAQRKKLGIWSMKVEKPSEWRHRK